MDLETLKTEFLSCSICTELYDELDHTPRLLRCRHYFCENCIPQFITDLSVTCPKCRDNYAIQSSDVNVFPKENTIRGLRDFLTSEDTSKEIKCQECSGHKARYYCQGCELFLCDECVNLHTSVTCTGEHFVRPVNDVFQEKLAHVQTLGAKVDAQLLVLSNLKKHLQAVKSDLSKNRDTILKQVSLLFENGSINSEQHSALLQRTNSAYKGMLESMNTTMMLIDDRFVLRESAKMNIQPLNACRGLEFVKKSDVIIKALKRSMETSLPENPIEYHELVFDEEKVLSRGRDKPFQDPVCQYSLSAWKSSVEMQRVRGCLKKKKVAVLHLYNVEGKSVPVTCARVALKATVEDPKGKTQELILSSKRPGEIDVVYVPRRHGKHILHLTLPGQSIYGGRYRFIVEKDSKSRSWRGTIYCPDVTMTTRRGEGTVDLSKINDIYATGVYFELHVSYTLNRRSVSKVWRPLFEIAFDSITGEEKVVAFACDRHDGICLSQRRERFPYLDVDKHVYLSPNKSKTSIKTSFGVYFNLQTKHILFMCRGLYFSFSIPNNEPLRVSPTNKKTISMNLRSGRGVKEIPKCLAGFPDILYSATANESVRMSSNCRTMTRAVLPVVAKEATNQLKYYPGAHGARIILPGRHGDFSAVCLIYAVRAAFSLRQMPTTDTTIFEIGLSPETQIDSYHSLVGKPKTAIFSGKFCSLHSSLCLCSSRSNVETNHTVLQNLDLKDELTFHFGFRIDCPKNVLKVEDIDENKTISSISFAEIDEKYVVVPVFGIPLPPSEGDSSVTLLNCKALINLSDIRVYGMALKKETIHQWIQSDLKTESWTLSLSRVPVQRGSTQLQRYQGAISSATVYGLISLYTFWYFQLHVVILVKEKLQQRCMVFEVGLGQKTSVDKHYCVAFQPNTYSFHAANCEEHSSICLFVTIGEELKSHEKLSANTAGTKVDKVFEFILSKERFSVTVTDIEKAEDGGFLVTTDVPKLLDYVHTFGLYLLPENGDLTITLVNSYKRDGADPLEEVYTKEEPEDNTDSDSDSDDEADKDDDGCFDSTFDKKMGPIESSDEDSGPSSFKEEKPLYDDSKESATFTYSADNSKMSEVASEVFYSRSKQPEPTISTILEDTGKQTLLNVIDGEDSEFMSNILSSMALCEISSVFNTCLARGKIKFSGKVLQHVCRQIELKEKDNCFHVYPSYRKGHGEDPIIVLLERQYSNLHSEQYDGWTVVRRRYDLVSPEAAIVMKSEEVQRDLLDVNQMAAIEEAIGQSDLPSKHSNITLISGCSYTSRNNGKILEKCPCIVVCCLLKGFIPYLEEPFPEDINGIRVDIREGFCVIGMMAPDIPGHPVTHGRDDDSETSNDETTNEEEITEGSHLQTAATIAEGRELEEPSLSGNLQSASSQTVEFEPKVGQRSDEINEPLLIGTAVGPIKGFRGTLGGFVNLTDGDMAFLTCAHVAESVGAEIIQPTRELPNTLDSGRFACGTVAKVVYSAGKKDEVGVDAAAVRITKKSRVPRESNFVKNTPEKLNVCGFRSSERLVFSRGLKRELREKLTIEERMMSVIKCGSETGLTRGILNISGAYCASVDPTFINGAKQNVSMYKQFEIMSIKGITRFSDVGDSGALVFLPKDPLQCIGMVIGHTNSDTCIVTPIECVLDALKVTFVDFQETSGTSAKRTYSVREGNDDISQTHNISDNSTIEASRGQSKKQRLESYLAPIVQKSLVTQSASVPKTSVVGGSQECTSVQVQSQFPTALPQRATAIIGWPSSQTTMIQQSFLSQPASVTPSPSTTSFQHQLPQPGPSGYTFPLAGISSRISPHLGGATFCPETTRIGIVQEGSLYKKDFDDCMSETVVGSLKDKMRSVGAIMTMHGLAGTAFRVGSHYVMTAYHVVRNIMDPFKSGYPDIGRVAAAVVDFRGDPTQLTQLSFRLRPSILYQNGTLDVAVLEIDMQANFQLPPPLQLHRGRASALNLTNVSLIGYGHPGKEVKHLEAACRVLPKTATEILEAKEWTKKHGYNIHGYDSKDADFNIVISCYMEHGASGAPLVSTHHFPQMPVVGVFTHGLPSYFCELPKFVQAGIPPKYRFEIATDTGCVYEDVCHLNPGLANHLFS